MICTVFLVCFDGDYQLYIELLSFSPDPDPIVVLLLSLVQRMSRGIQVVSGRCGQSHVYSGLTPKPQSAAPGAAS